MDNKLTTIIESLPTVLKNSQLNLHLEGWPAAVTIIAMCGTGIALYALKVTHPEQMPPIEKEVA